MKTMWIALMLLACGTTAPGLPGNGDGGSGGDGGTAVSIQGLDAVDANGEKIGVVLGLQQTGVLELWREDVQALMYVQMATGFVTQPNPILYATASCGGTAYMATFNGELEQTALDGCTDTTESAGVNILTAVGGSLRGGTLGTIVHLTSSSATRISGRSWKPSVDIQGGTGMAIPRVQPGQCADFTSPLQYCVRNTAPTALRTKYNTPIRFSRN